MRRLALSALVCAPLCAQDPVPAPFVRQYLAQAHATFEAGEIGAAAASVRRALERDDRNLEALTLLAEIAEKSGDRDTAVHTLHRWIEVFDAQAAPPVPRRQRRTVLARLTGLDPQAESWEKLREDSVKKLIDLAKQYRRREDWLGALDTYQSVLRVEPGNEPALDGVAAVRGSGGQEVAVEDLYAGTDPTDGLSAEQIALEDRRHAEWTRAYSKNTDSYRIKTDAGFIVLQTAAIAMEQVNGFYRKFFHYQEDGGKTPKIDIRIFKNREEYLDRGESPVEWSGGHFTGGAVETFVGGTSGEASIRSMYGTLFHEAAHQFVSLTGSVPGWLNEAYASFFEGCVILSNGSVKWNQAPARRLFPLASRLERGLMTSWEEAGPDENGKWRGVSTAPPFRMVVEGDYKWGPPWYAPTWGVVYFLYNYRDGDGRPVYRDALARYYASFKIGNPTDGAAHFEEIVLRRSPLSPVQDIDSLHQVWRDWIFDLRDRETGRTQQGDEMLRFAAAALERGEKEVALELLQSARENRPDDVEVLWQVAGLLEELGRGPKAAARYREFKRLLELGGTADDPRYDEATDKIGQLDPNDGRLQAIREEIEEKGLALARDYENRGLPMMAMEIARRLNEGLSIPAALDYYIDLAQRTEVSLARWRVAYNESNMEGWSQAGNTFDAYGGMIRSHLPDTGGESMATDQLACDVTFDGDFSLEAEMRIERDGQDFKGRLMGLCFGRKSGLDLHAVLLHPGGFLDVSSQRDGNWSILDHRSVSVGSEWRKLRIDVTGNTLDVYVDDLYLRSMEFPSAAAVRGGFGLIAGEGDAAFRNIRLLARDAFDPAARIERRLAMERIAADSSLRQSGNFSGLVPPELKIGIWYQGEPITLESLAGKPVMLLFWSPKQDAMIASTAYFNHLAEKGREAGLQTIVICDGGTRPDALGAWLQDHPMPEVRIAIDDSGSTYGAYFIKAGYFGIPRILLLDAEGKVVFEGDPGLRAGSAWTPADGPTYVDDAFARLIRTVPGTPFSPDPSRLP